MPSVIEYISGSETPHRTDFPTKEEAEEYAGERSGAPYVQSATAMSDEAADRRIQSFYEEAEREGLF